MFGQWGIKVTRFLRIAAVASLFAAALTPAQALVIGEADGANSIPFGGPSGGPYFQQVYSASSFSSPINISQITFYNSFYPGGAPATGTFDLYLSVTNAPIGTFDTSPMTFPDGSFVNVFHGTLPALSNGELNFDLLSSFLYDPSQGNLVLTVKSFDSADSGLFLDVDENVGVTNSRFSLYSYNWDQGLVTGFNTSVAAVPGPIVGAGIPGLVFGFGGLVACWRRARRACTTAA